ncbi:MAG: aminotransferase class III-fold pyridoxal phosphate-dependent enzyme [Anaerolineae bacterium]|nr:aminotransferase class III-fold pyridoxal phosphate-dependent enzyme [Gemmatimonadaceae bacterium]
MPFFSNRDTDDEAAEEAAEPEEISSDGTTWRVRAADLIPGGASTGSKRPDALYGPETSFGPTHFERAVGCRLVSTDGAELIDCSMALGAVALGYVEPSVTEAVINAARAGNVTGLSHTLEVEVAERLTAVIPCAEQVRFLKTGAEAVAAAVRIARAHTGRSHVIGCGYFGWLGWWKGATGLPAGAHADFETIPFDDAQALHEAAKRSSGKLAAIVLEPVIERLPSEEWLNVARRACDNYGAVLIFDEIKTGFRIRQGGYQEYSGITPDLATFGKAMANGFPLAAVVGKRDVMDAARSTWISSTLAGEGCALAAAGAVLDWHERAEVSEALWSIGGDMMAAVSRAVTASRVKGVSVEGIAPMWFLRFDDAHRESRFLELALEEGVLFKRGAYNFASLAHDDDTIAAIEGAASAAFVALREEAN